MLNLGQAPRKSLHGRASLAKWFSKIYLTKKRSCHAFIISYSDMIKYSIIA
jgi:hypothetical protein